MKEATVAEGPIVTIHDVPIPEILDPKQILIKVVVSGSNPKDWKAHGWAGKPLNAGDRVAAFHQILGPAGSFAEYALAWEWSTLHIPKNTTFEEASTIPLAAATAALSIYQNLSLPAPWVKPAGPLPLVVYGASSAVGAFGLKLARLSGVRPIIAIAGKGAGFVETIIDRSKGDTIVDYRNGDEATVNGIRQALNGRKLHYAFDAIADNGSFVNISKVVEPNENKLALVHPAEGLPDTINWEFTNAGETHSEKGIEKGTRKLIHAYFRLIG